MARHFLFVARSIASSTVGKYRRALPSPDYAALAGVVTMALHFRQTGRPWSDEFNVQDDIIRVNPIALGRFRMSNDYELKKVLASMLGVSVLATGLSINPVAYPFMSDSMGISSAFAKDGDSGEGGENGDDSGESGESGDDNSGKGSGNSGKGNSGKSGFGIIPDRFGRVVEKKSGGSKIELRYSDGWREEIEDGKYSLKNPEGRRVVSRKARNSDWVRMRSLAGS